MRRSRRMAAAMSALAVAAGGLVSAAVIGAGPVRADICDPAEAGATPTGQQRDDQQRNDRRNDRRDDRQRNDRRDDRQGRDQNQNQDPNQEQAPEQQAPEQDSAGQESTGRQDDGRDTAGQDGTNQDGTNQDGTDQQAPQGGGAALDPAPSPEAENAGDAGDAEESASTFSRRGRPTRGADPRPNPSQTQPDDPDGDATEEPSPGASPTGSPSPSPTASGDQDECADLGPFREDFVDIRRVAPRRLDARTGRNGSRGTFVSRCGTNRNGHHNPDNFIVAPGVTNGAHHLHDYVGNLSTDAFSTDESLEAAGTTCRLGDKSTYYWPVLRNRKVDANAGDPDGNVGQVLRPRAATLQFRGNATSRVVPMPRFMRVITGDAKAGTNGGANARAGWSCSGFQNRISPDKYPLCPRGSQVLRILDFPSCWDGQNTDSANHRTHVVFPDQSGACPQGTRAIPQLRMTLSYTVPQGPSYAVDAFPEQKHNPVTDHGDFVNVMPERLMRTVVDCINRGRRC